MIAFCFLPAVAMRATPSHSAEMVNQLLFGDHVELLDQQPEWLLVRSLFDNYRGWVSRKQLAPVEQPVADLVCVADSCRIVVPAAAGLFPTDLPLTITLGACCPEAWLAQPLPPGAATPPQAARRLLGAPYLWGGRTPLGIDCSGLVQVAHKACGIALPRDASQQAQQGTAVPFDALLAGDLAFFEERGRIVHVGLCLGDGQILHASGQVRIDRLASDGIHDLATHRLTHRLHSLRRLA